MNRNYDFVVTALCMILMVAVALVAMHKGVGLWRARDREPCPVCGKR